MEKQFAEIRSELAQHRRLLETIHQHLVKLVPTNWPYHLQVVPVFGVILQPGQCHTFPSAPTGHVTIANQTDDNGMIEMSWNNTVNSGEVQPQSTRVAEPHEWPATFCNTGMVPLTVTPS